MKSFRSRLLLGSILFIGGLLPLFHLASMTIFRRFPHVFSFRLDHTTLVVVALALVFIVIGLSQMRRGLSPFDQLRARLAAVRDGHERRLEGRYPSEVQPLVNDLNALLEHRDEVIRRALGKAGDLAHGLKTPLAVLIHEADRAGAAGQHDVAAEIRAQLDRMRRQIDYHLAHARAAAFSTPQPPWPARCCASTPAEDCPSTSTSNRNTPSAPNARTLTKCSEATQRKSKTFSVGSRCSAPRATLREGLFRARTRYRDARLLPPRALPPAALR
jgi:hypothetical protein